jgi:C1A family cysteine protease
MTTDPTKYSLIIERGTFPEKVTDFSLSTPLPGSVDLRSKLKIIYDQGNLGSCTANALCCSFVYDDSKYTPSRLFLYYNERMLDKDVSHDVGSTLTQGINALEKYGVCQESTWPYIINKFAIKPPVNAYTEGVQHQVLSAKRVQQTMSSMKGCLNSGFPFVLGIEIYSSFESQVVTNTGYVPMPNTEKEQLLGGHAVICVGYNDAKGVWIMQNSWGILWGDKGYFYLPYNYLLSSTLAGDMWQITKVRVLNTPQKIMINKINEVTKYRVIKYRR